MAQLTRFEKQNPLKFSSKPLKNYPKKVRNGTNQNRENLFQKKKKLTCSNEVKMKWGSNTRSGQDPVSESGLIVIDDGVFAFAFVFVVPIRVRKQVKTRTKKLKRKE